MSSVGYFAEAEAEADALVGGSGNDSDMSDDDGTAEEGGDKPADGPAAVARAKAVAAAMKAEAKAGTGGGRATGEATQAIQAGRGTLCFGASGMSSIDIVTESSRAVWQSLCYLGWRFQLAHGAALRSLRLLLYGWTMVCSWPGSIEAAMAELDMEHYDDEEATAGGRIFGSGNPGMALYRRAALSCLANLDNGISMPLHPDGNAGLSVRTCDQRTSNCCRALTLVLIIRLHAAFIFPHMSADHQN